MKILLLDPEESESDSKNKICKISSLIKQLRHEVVEYKANKAFYEKVISEKPDVVFNLASIYGLGNSNLIPAILEIADVRYTGSGLLGLSLARSYTKLFTLLLQSGIPLVPFIISKVKVSMGDNHLRYPLRLFRDGCCQNTVVSNNLELKRALKSIPQQENIVLQEYSPNSIKNIYLCNSWIFPANTESRFINLAREVYRLIEARGIVRFDFRDSYRAALTGIEISPDPLGKQLLEKARLSGWDEKRIIQLMIDQAGRDRDIAMPYKEMNL